jgi:hypothetical protein
VIELVGHDRIEARGAAAGQIDHAAVGDTASLLALHNTGRRGPSPTRDQVHAGGSGCRNEEHG